MFIGQDLLHTTQGKHLVFLPFFFFSHSFSFTLFLSFCHSFCPSFSHFPRTISLFICFCLLFLKPTAASPPCSSPRCPAQFIFSGFFTLLLFFCYPFVSPLPLLPLSVFILYYFGTSLSVLSGFKAAPSLFGGGVHLFSAPG